MSKSQQLQIRVSPDQKKALKRLAGAAGLDVSSYVLTRALSPAKLRFAALIDRLRDEDDYRFALAEINDLLSKISAAELIEAVEQADVTRLSPLLRNYVAAMVEQACHLKRLQAPLWTARIAPLACPWFAAPLASLRLHLLRTSPVAFKRRNIFVDASIGDRV